MKFIGLVLAVFLTTNAFAGVDIYSGASHLGTVNTIKCSTGLTCTKAGATLTATSSPTLTGTSLSLSSTLAAGGDFAIATNKFNVTAATGNTAVAGTLNSVGDFSVATNKFNVTASSGNTSTAGTLASTGNFAVATNKFTVAAASGNTLVAGTMAVTGASTLTGALTASGGIAASGGQRTRFLAWPPPTLTSGTSTTPSTTVLYLSQIYIPANTTLTGIKVNNGATCGTNKWIVALFDSTGAPVANSSTSGVTCSGTDAYQAIPFTGTYAAVGPAVYWIGLYANGTTDRFRTIPAVGEFAGLAGSVSAQTFGTVASVTLPTTFSADLGPVGFVY